MCIESVMPSNHLILCPPLLLLPSILPSIRVFSNESVLHISWPKYWSFSFSISPSNEYSGLISFKDGLVGSPCKPRDSQESFPIPQFKSINSSVLSFLYSPTLTSVHGKTIALYRWIFSDKVMSLLFNILSRLVIAFFPKEQASFNFMAAVTICSDFGALDNKACHCFQFPHLFPIKLWD